MVYDLFKYEVVANGQQYAYAGLHALLGFIGTATEENDARVLLGRSTVRLERLDAWAGTVSKAEREGNAVWHLQRLYA